MFVTDFEKIDFVLPAELKHILLFELHFEPLQDQFLKYQFEVVRILFHGFLQVFHTPRNVSNPLYFLILVVKQKSQFLIH